MTLPVAVHVSADAPPEGVDQLLHEVRAIGLEPTLKTVPTRRGVSDLAWLVLLALPMRPFFEVLAQKLAGDAYSQLKAFVGKVLHRQRGSHDGRRVLVLQDNTTGLQVILEADLPLEAYQQLFLVNLTSITRGPLHYDRNRRKWRSELDEWQQQNTPHDHSLDRPRRG